MLPSRLARIAVAAVLAVAALGLDASAGHAAVPSRRAFLAPAPAAPVPATRTIPAVGGANVADPAGGAAERGTMLMVHAGGWAGHDPSAAEQLVKRPGDLLVQRGWRVVSIDYEEGTAGLQDVLNAAGAELSRRPGAPLCIYGESAGAHLALVAASRLRSVDCVIGLGTPTDLPLYARDGAASPDPLVRLVASQISRFFGSTLADLAPWDPVTLAPSIHADVLLIHEADDMIVPAEHTVRFQAASPTTQTLELQAGDRADPATHFVHGTVSEAARDDYAAAVGAFADRAVADHGTERSAKRSGCPYANRFITQLGGPGLRDALRCLARGDAQSLRAGRGDWQRTSVTLRGEVSAARIWARLRTTRGGRRALTAAATRRANISVRTGDRSRITLRVR